MQPEQEIKILFLEDDPDAANLLRERLTLESSPSFRVECVRSLKEALERLGQGGIDLVLTDLNVPDSEGLGTFLKLHAQAPELPMVVLTGASQGDEMGLKAVREGAQDYLVKGEIGGKFLVKALRYAVERKRTRNQIEKLSQELERRVTERTVQLEAVNKELEMFSYSISHDLRAPLRNISGFVEALLEDYADKLDPQGVDTLQCLSAESERMDRLINDLLNLSRLSSGEIHRDRVNLSVLAREIAEGLQRAQPKRRVSFFIADGITTYGDSNLLRLVLENLMGNAWKFTGRRSTARIAFGAMQKEGRPVYFVRDDGAGFDPAYANKLFGAFQRLHSQTEFSGTGIGLATAQRVVHRHGGHIWAEGVLGKGATFYFTLEDSHSNRKEAHDERAVARTDHR